MPNHTPLSTLCAISTLALFLAAGCAGPQHLDEDQPQSSARVAQSQDTDEAPDLKGTPLSVCPDLEKKGLAASSFAIDNGFAVMLGTHDESLADTMRDKAQSWVDKRNDIEEAFSHIHATQHDDGDGVYVRFESSDEDALPVLKKILQRGIDNRPMAKNRVSLREGDGYIEMQLPSGGPLITSKTKKGAENAVDEWTDRTPTTFSYSSTDTGFEIDIQTDDSDRLDGLRKVVRDKVFECPQ